MNNSFDIIILSKTRIAANFDFVKMDITCTINSIVEFNKCDGVFL